MEWQHFEGLGFWQAFGDMAAWRSSDGTIREWSSGCDLVTAKVNICDEAATRCCPSQQVMRFEGHNNNVVGSRVHL